MADEYKVSITLAAKVNEYVKGLDTAAKATARLRDAQTGTSESSAVLAAQLTAAGSAAKGSTGDLNAMTRAVRRLEVAERKLNDERQRGGRSGSPARNPVPSADDIPNRRRSNDSDDRRRSEKIAGYITSPIDAITNALPAEVKAAVVLGLVAAGGVAAPLVGAAVAGGILAAVGGGALGAGIAASITSGDVSGAVNGLKSDFGRLASGIGDEFADELGSGLNFLGSEVDRLGPAIRGALAPAAGYIEPLVQGLSGLVEGVLPGLKAGVVAAQPVFDAISAELPYLGQALGDLFATMAEHADEGAAAIELILITIEDTITFAGAFVGLLSDGLDIALNIGLALATVGSALVPDALGGGVFAATRSELLEVQATANGTNKAVSGAFDGISDMYENSAGHAAEFGERQKILNGSMTDGIRAAGGLKQALDALNGGALGAEAAEDAFQEALDSADAALKKNGRTLDTHTEKGRANRQALRDIADTTIANADAQYKAAAATGTIAEAEDASERALRRGRKQLIAQAIEFGRTRKQAEAYANQVLGIPGSKRTKIELDADDAMAKARALAAYLADIPDQDVNVAVRLTGQSPSQAAASIRKNYANAAGGKYTPMAAGGIAGVYAASDPPLMQFAEPRTGGELYLPKKGISQERGRQLVAEGAQWYGLKVSAMAGGGIMAAASGLVNVAGADTSGVKATRLDYAEAYLQARDAVKSLSTALKDNGRSFDVATQKGRDNRSALYSGIRAAQDAAKTKFEETGNVRLANKAYDGYIARLRATLQQQKVNRATIKSLLSLAQRPDYGAPATAPKNSLSKIQTTRSQISALGALSDLRDALSLNKPTTALSSAEGRENLSSVLDYLESASQLAQDVFAQTGSSKTASATYRRYVGQLKKSLTANGYSSAKIGQLLQAYGRITLVPNAAGGAYGAAAYGPGKTLYQFREPSTGGEAFVPRYGNQANAERVLSLAAGWRGGVYVPQQQVAAAAGGSSSHMTLNNFGEPMTVAKFQQAQRAADVHNRQGRAK